MKNIKSHQRDQVIREFGILFQPFYELALKENAPNLKSYRMAIAKVQAGDGRWRQTVMEFTTFAQDITFVDEYNEISHVPERFRMLIKRIINDPSGSIDLDSVHERFKIELTNAQDKFHEAVNKVPFEWEPMLFEANTPFTSYLRIKESIAYVKHRLHYFDRYLSEDFFHLFLKFLDRNISVRLITTKDGINNTLHISALAHQEFRDYQLIEVKPKIVHDRNLRIDNQIFTLGPSFNRVGMSLTNFGPSDSSAAAHLEFDKIIAQGNIVPHPSKP